MERIGMDRYTRGMIVRSSLVVSAVVAAVASFGLVGCDRGGKSVPSTSGSAAASASQAPATLDAAAVKTASCAAFNKTIVKVQTASNGFIHALDDPKRSQDWNKPLSDAADNAAVILAYAAKDIESNVIKPGLASDLSDQFKQFVKLLRDRAGLLNQHAGTDELNPNGDQVTDLGRKLIRTCQ